MIHIFFWITILGFVNSPVVFARGGGTSSPGLAMFSLIVIGFLAIAFYYEDRYLKITGRKFGPFTLSIILAVIGSLIISFLLLIPFGIKFADSGLFLGLMIIFISYWFIIKYLMSPIYKDNNGKLINDCGSTPVLADTSKYDTNQLNNNSDLLCDNSHQQQLSSSATTLSLDIESGPRGVGGWLLFLIIGMIFLGPLIGAARTNFNFMTTESNYPNIAYLEQWVSYKNITWWILFATSALSVYGGVTLARSSDSSAVERAIWILWLIGPGGVVIDNIAASNLLKDFSFFNLEFIKNLIISLANPIIWSAYLKKSKRVKNSYKYSDPLDTALLWEKRSKQRGFWLVHILLATILSIYVLIYLFSKKDHNIENTNSTANLGGPEQTALPNTQNTNAQDSHKLTDKSREASLTPDLSQPSFTDSQIQPEFIEQKPPAQTNASLTQEQINYCFAEEIRLDASMSILDRNNTSQINYYNALIDDYNKRCLNYNFIPGSLDKATSNAVYHRERLKSEGQERILQINNKKSDTNSNRGNQSFDLPVVKLSPNAPPVFVYPKNNYQVEEVQRLLYSKGYYKGVVDGIYGPNTRSAIVNFQKDQGVTPDGKVSDSLISHLNRTIQSYSRIDLRTGSEASSNNTVVSNNLQGQNLYPGRPSMARATASEQASIENACAPARRDDGQNAYYHCITQQMNALGYQ